MESIQSDFKLKSTILDNKKIVISGTFQNISREGLKKLIEENGGKNSSSVSKATDILVAGENMGPSKLEKANNFKIKILNEEEFLKLINQQNNSDAKQYEQGELFKNTFAKFIRLFNSNIYMKFTFLKFKFFFRF